MAILLGAINGQGCIAKKLDRFFANEAWLDGFSDVQAEFSAPEFSYHCAGILKWQR